MKFQCAKCGKELKRVLPTGQEASKMFLRSEGYDGVEWTELYDLMTTFELPLLPEPYTLTQQIVGEEYKATFVKFCLCLGCIPRDFNFVGEKVK